MLPLIFCAFSGFGCKCVADEVPGPANSLLELGGVAPAQVMEAGDVHELAWGAVGFGGVEDEIAFETEDFGYGLGQFADGDVFARADVDEGWIGLR